MAGTVLRSSLVTLLTGIALGLVTLALAACGGAGDEGTGTTSPVPTGTSAAQPTASPRTGGPSTSPAVGGPTATATPAASEAAQAAAAATAIFGGVVDAACTPSPETPVCIIPDPSLGTPERGTAAFATSEYPGSGAMEFLGQTPAGEWQFWFGTQDITYQLTVLPGEMRVCAGGEGLKVRSSGAVEADVLTVLNDDAIITVDRFLLTEPGSRSPTTGAQAGFGWYHLTSPQEGWAYSRYLSAASLGDCSVHDALVPD
jgi:hypothetical protein